MQFAPPVAIAARRVRVVHVYPHVGADGTALADMHLADAVASTAAAAAATTADATSRAQATRDADASGAAFARVAARRQFVGPVVGGVDVSVAFVANGCAVLVAGAGSGGRHSGVRP